MTDNLVYLNNVTKLDIPPDRVLAKAAGKLQQVIVIGYTTEGAEYFASSVASGPEAVWLLERMKLKLLTIVEESDK